MDESFARSGTHAGPEPLRRGPILSTINVLATVQIVWFYLARTQCQVNLALFEQGRERTPFQYRLLLMWPLRWAHQSAWLQTGARLLSRQSAWFPHGIRPEGLLEAALDLLAVAITGRVVELLYQRSSPTRLLALCAYPATLGAILCTYTLMSFHAYRFPADLPAMAFFASGLWLIAEEAHPVWFVLIFLLGTLNRETTLMLLLPFAFGPRRNDKLPHERKPQGEAFDGVGLRRVLGVGLPLLAAWIAWRLWIAHHYAANPSAAGPRLALNLATILVPLAWPQLAAACGFLLPAVFCSRTELGDELLRRWWWLLPAWLGCMAVLGLFVEIRIFGELIPYVVPAALLLGERSLLRRLGIPPEVAAEGLLLPRDRRTTEADPCSTG